MRHTDCSYSFYMEKRKANTTQYGSQLLAFYGLACSISWLVWAPLWLPALGIEGLPLLPFHHAIGAVGPIAAAFIVTTLSTGQPGAAELWSRMFLWRGRFKWIAIALFAPFVIFLLATAGAFLFAGEPFSLGAIGRSSEFPQFSLFTFLLYNIFSFGYGEEVGWRGFALPRLQKRYSAFISTLLLSVAWALWHLPLFFYRPGYLDMDIAGTAGWFFSLLTGAVLLTWLYNSSRGSLLVAALFHATIDVAFTSDVSSDFVVNAMGFLITVWGIGVLVWAGPKYLSGAGKMGVGPDGQQEMMMEEQKV